MNISDKQHFRLHFQQLAGASLDDIVSGDIVFCRNTAYQSARFSPFFFLFPRLSSSGFVPQPLRVGQNRSVTLGYK